ncbi:MAG TPA: DUF3813 domain-containing protein [Bacillus bacterium]|nr:DUF3813 domain-containing protein [Bacillus sp. (in: firmicutes)]
MGNKLFQLAKEAVHLAETTTMAATTPNHFQEAQTNIDKAKNQISSAFANSTSAEQMQLQELQQRLDEIQNSIK